MSVEVVVTCQSLRVEPEGDTLSSVNDMLVVSMTTCDATEFHGLLTQAQGFKWGGLFMSVHACTT